MTHNLPDNLPDNLPARVRPDFGAAAGRAVPLEAAPTVALAFALGYACARPQSANHFGPFVALCQELMARPGAGGDGIIRNSEWSDLLAVLPPAQANALSLLYRSQRGQAWAQTGRKPR